MPPVGHHMCSYGMQICAAAILAQRDVSDPPFLTSRVLSPSDHQHQRHGGRDIQEAGEGARLLRDRRGRGERDEANQRRCDGQSGSRNFTNMDYEKRKKHVK